MTIANPYVATLVLDGIPASISVIHDIRLILLCNFILLIKFICDLEVTRKPYLC